MRKLLTIYLILLLTITGKAQEGTTITELVKNEIQLSGMYDRIYSEQIFGTNISLTKSIDSLFYNSLLLPGAFDYTWDKLGRVGKLKSDDDKIKVISWLYMENRNQYHYFAYLLVRGKKGEHKVYRFNPAPDGPDVKKGTFKQSLDNWHAKIYYDLVTTEYKRKTFYTLVGMDFNNVMTSIKTIEVLTFIQEEPIFRADQFLVGGTVKDRMILEFSADLACTVHFDERMKMIVYDHLAPFHAIYEGIFQFYGPDGSYDAIEFIDGIWVRQEDVDARNE